MIAVISWSGEIELRLDARNHAVERRRRDPDDCGDRLAQLQRRADYARIGVVDSRQ